MQFAHGKIDRLMTETKLDPSAAYFHISQVLEQVGSSFLIMGKIIDTWEMLVFSKNNEKCVKATFI